MDVANIIQKVQIVGGITMMSSIVKAVKSKFKLKHKYDLMYIICKIYLLLHGIKLIGRDRNVFYGVNGYGVWIFYLQYGLRFIYLTEFKSKQRAELYYRMFLED